MIISVVIAFVQNDKKYLKKCLQSIENSAKIARIPLEFILVANGTGIKNINYLKFPVKIIKNKFNIGFGQAINQCVTEAAGKWCLLTCPDVLTDKQCLSNIFKNIAKNKLAIIGPKIFFSDASLQPTILPYPTLKNIFLEQTYLYKILPFIFRSPLTDKKNYKVVNSTQAVAAIWWLFNKKIFVSLGGFDKRFFLYFEDVDLCRRITLAGYKIVFNPLSLVHHLSHRSTKGITSGSLYLRSLSNYMSKYPFFYKYISLFIFISGCFFRLLYWSATLMFISDKNKSLYAKNKIKFCFDVLKEY